VLWSLCLLSSFAIVLGYETRQKVTLVSRLDERDKLHFIAEAGIQRAILELNKEPGKAYDARNDLWGNNSAVFKGINIGDGSVDICYNNINEQSGLTETVFGLVDEERKININKADAKVLERFFHCALGFDEVQAQELAASIVDWRDSDSELSIPLGSAEDYYYRGLAHPYEAKDGEFELLEELLLVNGMTHENFEKIRNYITIYGNGKININTAGKFVLLALGLNDDIVDKILSFRAGEDKLLGTPDDNVFDATANIVPKLSQFYDLSEAEVAQLSAAAGEYLAVNSNNFMARGIVRLNGRKNSGELVSVVNRKGKIFYWQES